jgi:hypothetical protein
VIALSDLGIERFYWAIDQIADFIREPRIAESRIAESNR